jgi:hypothetical protein
MARSTKQKTISLDKETLARGLRNAAVRGFKNSFSAYLAKRIVEDEVALSGNGDGEGKPRTKELAHA